MAAGTALLATHVALVHLHWTEGAFHGPPEGVARLLALAVWIPLLALGTGVLIGLVRPLHPPALLACAIFLGFSLVVVDVPDTLGATATRVLRSVGGAAALAVPALTLWFALVFPARAPLLERLPWLRAAAVLGSAAWWVAVGIGSRGMAQPMPRSLAWATFLWCSALYATAITVLLEAPGREMRPDHRHRLRVVALGTGIGLGALGVLATAARLGITSPWLTAVAALAMGAFPASFAYAVVRHRVFDVDVIIRRGLQYLFVSRAVGAVEIAVMALFALWAWQSLVARRPWQLLLVIAVASTVEATWRALSRQIMPAIDRRFFREAYDARRILLDVGEDVRRLASRPAELVEAFTGRIRAALHPVSVAQHDVPPVVPPDHLLVPLGERPFLVLGPKLSEEPWTREDRELLDGAAQQVGIALENARLFARVAEQERLRREMEIARQVQQRLFPHAAVSLPSLACSGACRPALGVGGDYYDVLPLGPSLLGLALGDVSGKGISAALLMASLQALLRSHAPLHPGDPPRVIEAVNRLLHASSDAARFVTLFYATWDAGARALSYVNAGHNPPFLVRRGRSAADAETLRDGGLVLGLLPESSWTAGRVHLDEGDLLVLYSDGLTEADDAGGEMFGERRLLEVVERHRDAPLDTLRDALLDAVERFASDEGLRDDRTVLVARVGPA